MRRAIGYALLFVWTAIASVAQLTFLSFVAPLEKGDASIVRAAIPDLATVLLVASIGRLSRHDVVRLALVVALGRIGFTAAPPLAVVAGCMAVALVADSVRRIAELDRASLRFVAAGLGAFAYACWLLFVDLVRASEARSAGGLSFGSVEVSDWTLPIVTALTSALLALVAWPLLASLPGLGRLERRAF